MAVAAAAAVSLGTPILPAYADDAAHTATGSQTYDSAPASDTDSTAKGWNTQATDAEGAGKIKIVYDTTGGNWQDPGADPAVTDDNGSHVNGTYVVTIPTLIEYKNMNIGVVNTSDDYSVNVRGAIDVGKKVTLTATTDEQVKNGNEALTETTTQGKTEWSADECFGDADSAAEGAQLNADGSLAGTGATDNIKLSGTVKTAGEYSGYVTYTAALADA